MLSGVKIIGAISLVCLSACTAQNSAPRLRPLLSDNPAENIESSLSGQLLIELEIANEGVGAEETYLRIRMPNLALTTSKLLEADFGQEFLITLGEREYSLRLGADRSFFETDVISLTPALRDSLLSQTIGLKSLSDQSLAVGSLRLTPRLVASDFDPEDLDLFNCFGTNDVPFVQWIGQRTGNTIQLRFDRLYGDGQSIEFNEISDSGRWDEGVRSRELFQALFTETEKQSSGLLIEEFERSIQRTHRLGFLELATVPSVRIPVELRLREQHLMFIYFRGSCE